MEHSVIIIVAAAVVVVVCSQVDATQRMLLEELPPVLVLHLKWFTYDKNGGLQKCMKQVDFDIDLEIGKGLFFYSLIPLIYLCIVSFTLRYMHMSETVGWYILMLFYSTGTSSCPIFWAEGTKCSVFC